MRISITARHCDVSDQLRTRAATVLRRLGSLVSRPVDGTIVFDVSAGRPQAEIRLAVRGGSSVATADGKNHRTALDRAEDKIRRQLVKGAQAKRTRGAKGAV